MFKVGKKILTVNLDNYNNKILTSLLLKKRLLWENCKLVLERLIWVFILQNRLHCEELSHKNLFLTKIYLDDVNSSCDSFCPRSNNYEISIKQNRTFKRIFVKSKREISSIMVNSMQWFFPKKHWKHCFLLILLWCLELVPQSTLAYSLVRASSTRIRSILGSGTRF